MKLRRFAIAVVELTATSDIRNNVLTLRICEGKTWQDALNRHTAVVWHIPPAQSYEDMQEEAVSSFACMVAIQELHND